MRIFSDLEHKDWIISLVNALSGTHYTENELIEVNTIEEILYIKMKNDVSYLIDHQLFLIEHQSSYNPNMPLRGLIYFGQLYDSYIQQHNLNVYSSRRIKLPRPQFFVMYNINAGHNNSLLNACQPLQQYSLFVGKIHQGRLAGLSLDAALSQAVDYGIEHNFFDGLLRKLKGDIMSILFKEYTDEEANTLFYNDGHDAGYDEGYNAGAAEQRAKDESELRSKEAELAAQAAKLAQYEKLYGKLEL